MKIASRKFFITIYWMVLGLGFIIGSILGDTAIPVDLITWIGIVSCMYIGGNVLQKFVLPILENRKGD